MLFLFQVAFDDDLPKLLCCDCSQQINQFFSFKQACLRSNEILRKCIIDLKDDQQLNVPLLPVHIDLVTENVEITNVSNTEYYCESIKQNEGNIQLEDQELNKNLKCNHCPDEFELENDLEIHLICHPQDRTNILCTKCNKTFTNLRMLKRHVRIHMTNKPFSCEMCNKKFAENFALTKHLRKHRGERRHLCTLCGKSFYEANVLSVHMRTHTGLQYFYNVP